MEIGKLDSKLLEDIVFKNIKYKREEILVRAGIGEDCATIDFGDYDCVVSTDPITASVKDVGRLAIHISCNDIAANGIEPLGILLTLMLPKDIRIEDIEDIMKSAGEAAAMAKVEIIGGHTEITSAVNQPIIVSTAIGRALKGRNQVTDNMKPGDIILVTKEVGLEGTGIIASDCPEKISEFLSNEEIETAKKMLEKVSVVRDGIIAGEIGTHGMHDITEGGILGALWEMCEIKKVGCEVFEEKIPVNPVTLKLCKTLNIDWLKLISSGAMLIIAPKEKEKMLIEAFDAADTAISKIGEIKEGSAGKTIVTKNGAVKNIEAPGRDEIYRVIS